MLKNLNNVGEMRGVALAAIALLALGTVSGSAPAQTSDGEAFITDMSEFGWNRQDPNSTFWSWGAYFAADGPNPPNIGGFPVPIPAEFSTPDVFDSTASSFITVEFPNYDLGDGFETEIVIQVLTLGNELDPGSVELDAEGLTTPMPPDEIRELDRRFLGSGQFGGDRVETLFRWVVPGNEAEYTARFTAAAPSVSWSDFTIDTFAREADDPCSRLDITGDGSIDIADLIGYLEAFFAGQSWPFLDFNQDQSIDIADLIAFVNAFFDGCN